MVGSLSDYLPIITISLIALVANIVSVKFAFNIPGQVNSRFKSAIERITLQYRQLDHYFVYGEINPLSFRLITYICVAFGDFFILLPLAVLFDASTQTGFFYFIISFGFLFALGFPLILDIIALKTYNVIVAVTVDGVDYWEFNEKDDLIMRMKWSELSDIKITTGRNPSMLEVSGIMKVASPTWSFEIETSWVNVPEFYKDILSHATNAKITKRDREIMEERSAIVG